MAFRTCERKMKIVRTRAKREGRRSNKVFAKTVKVGCARKGPRNYQGKSKYPKKDQGTKEKGKSKEGKERGRREECWELIKYLQRPRKLGGRTGKKIER